MTVINLRGGSGSGKSTLVQMLMKDYRSFPILEKLSDWKKDKIVAYHIPSINTYLIGRYETQCGGCDAMSYKGSHDDIEMLIRRYLLLGNVIYEGLTISSTMSRWRRISDENPGQFIWAFMMTPEEECHRRILARNGGKEPKRNEKGIADYQIKYRGCMHQREALLLDISQSVADLTSDEKGYEGLLFLLGVIDASPFP